MKNVFTFAAALTAAALTLCSCASSNSFSDSERLSSQFKRNASAEVTYNYSDGATDPPTSYNSYTAQLLNFELKLFRVMNSAAEKGQNQALSPSAVALELSLLANGAADKTLGELFTVLGNELDVLTLNQGSSYFASRMAAVSALGAAKAEKSSDKAQEQTEYVNLDNSLLINDSADLKTAFLQADADYYGDDIYRFDFSSDYNEKLALRYPKGVTAQSLGLNDAGSMTGVCCAKVEDMWLNAYSQEDVSKGVFKGESAETELSFMSSSESCLSTDRAEGIIKYTAKNPLKLILILPKSESLDEYVKTFDSTEYMNLLESFDVTQSRTAVIPQFAVTQNYAPRPLAQTLQKTGLFTLFDSGASFKNMSFSENLCLNDIVELAPDISISAGGISSSGSSPSVALPAQSAQSGKSSDGDELRFDKPFIFIIADNESNLPLFIGTFSDAS